MLDIDEIIASAKLPEKTLEVCLRGDLQADWEDLERQLRAVEAADTAPVLGGNPEAQALAERMEALAQEMRDHVRVFRFRGLSSKKYSDLLMDHKSDDDNSVDGLDWDTLPVAVVAACAVNPTMTVEKAARLCDTVSNKQWDDLFETAMACNRSQVNIPFSLSASAIRAGIASKSAQPERGASQDQNSSVESLAG